MYRTISLGGTILAQGLQEALTSDGRVIIRVGDETLKGWPVDVAPEKRIVSTSPN
mgnify:CR=1 FL=1